MMNPDPLKSDPKRQAVPVLKGYAYQAWRSALQWVRLEASEVLFLEGAEDFDVVTSDEAITIQVKDTAGSGSVTLNNQDVLNALKHFWEHQRNNPIHLVRFHFLSTSKRGNEQGDPFGGNKGLDYWDACKRDGMDVGLLRTFLTSKTILPDDLRDFVAGASDSELREKLVRRIEWITDSGSHEYIHSLVESKIIDYGARVQSLPPSDSTRVVPFVYKHIWDVVIRSGERLLRFSDFAELFEQVTTERVSTRELRLLRGQAGVLSEINPSEVFRGVKGSATPDTVASSTLEVLGLPVVDRLARREQLVVDLNRRLVASGILVIRGSTGMGKSTLASQVISSNRNEWRYLDFRGYSAAQVRDRLLHTALYELKIGTNRNCLIDDLNFEGGAETYTTALSGLIHMVISEGGFVIITAQGELPSRVRLSLDLPDNISTDAPALTEAEISEVAANYGCPEGRLRDTWSRIISATTIGHPQLVHANIVNLSSNKWREPTLEDLSKSENLEVVRREARTQLRDQIPESARALAYRLSIFLSYFKRSHALSLATALCPQAIQNPGEAFDLLVGPWVERLEHGYFRLSALLQGAANQVFTQAELTRLHYAASDALACEQPMTPSEARGLILHAITGGNDLSLARAYFGLLKIENVHWPQLASELDIIGYLALGINTQLYARDPLLSLLLRHLQFKIACESLGRQQAHLVAERWSDELHSFDDTRAFAGAKLPMQVIFLNSILSKLRGDLSMRLLVPNVARTLAMIELVKAQAPASPAVRTMIATFGPSLLDCADYLFFAATECRRAVDLMQFVFSLSSLPQEVAVLVWNGFKNNNYLSMLLIDGVWLQESKEEAPNWDFCLKVLDYTASAASTAGADSVVAASYRAKAIVLEEYMNDSARALAVLDEGQAKLGHRHLILDDYRTKIFALQSKDEEAVKRWIVLAPELDSDGNPGRAFSYQAAAISASKLDQWELASKFSLGAEQAVRQANWTGELAPAFKADRAFAEWMSAHRAEAISLFAECIDELATLPEPQNHKPTDQVRVKVAFALQWIAKSLKEESPGGRPWSGWFSDSNRESDIDQDTAGKLSQSVCLWYLLAEIEISVGTGDLAFERFEQAATKNDALHIRSILAALRIRRSLRCLRFEQLIDEYVSFEAAFFNYVGAQSGPPNETHGSQLLVALLFAALVKLVAANDLQFVLVSIWRGHALRLDLLDDRVNLWLDSVESTTKRSDSELIGLIKDGHATGDARLVAALLLSAKDSLDPETRFYANMLILSTPNLFGFWAQDVEDDISGFVSKGWSTTIKEYRANLLAPRLTVQAIVDACDDTSRGLKKAARILLAARGAVSTRIPDEMLSHLTKLAS